MSILCQSSLINVDMTGKHNPSQDAKKIKWDGIDFNSIKPKPLLYKGYSYFYGWKRMDKNHCYRYQYLVQFNGAYPEDLF